MEKIICLIIGQSVTIIVIVTLPAKAGVEGHRDPLRERLSILVRQIVS